MAVPAGGPPALILAGDIVNLSGGLSTEYLTGAFVASIHRSSATGVFTITMQTTAGNEVTGTFYSGATVAAVEPASGLYEGFEWWDSVNKELKIYDGSAFVAIAGGGVLNQDHANASVDSVGKLIIDALGRAYLTQITRSYTTDPTATFANFAVDHYIGVFSYDNAPAISSLDDPQDFWYDRTNHVLRKAVIHNNGTVTWAIKAWSDVLTGDGQYVGAAASDAGALSLIQHDGDLYFRSDAPRRLRIVSNYVPGGSEVLHYDVRKLLDVDDDFAPDHLLSMLLPIPTADALYEVRNYQGNLYRVEPRQLGAIVDWDAYADGDDVSDLWGEQPATYRYRGEYHISDAGNVPSPQADDVIITPGGSFLRYISAGSAGFIYFEHPAHWLRRFASEAEADHHVTAVGQTAAFARNLQQVLSYVAADILYRWEPYEPAETTINSDASDFDGNGGANTPLQLAQRRRIDEAPAAATAYTANQYVSVGNVFYRVLNDVTAAAAAIAADGVNFRRLGAPVVSATEPTAGLYEGLLWWNSATNELHVYGGTAFFPLGAPVVSAAAPTAGLYEGLLWWNRADDELNVYDGSAFVAVSAGVELSDDDPEDVAAAAAAGAAPDAAHSDHAHALAVDTTLRFSAQGELGVNVQDVVEHLSETVRYFTDEDNYNNDQHAAKGEVYTTSPYDKHISQVDIDHDTAGDYFCRIVKLDDDNNITAILGSSSGFTHGTAARGVSAFSFSRAGGGVPVGRNDRIAILLVRIDGGNSARCTLRRGAQAGGSPDVSYGNAGDDFHLVGRTHRTDNDPQTGDSLLDPPANSDILGNMRIHYTINYDHANFVSATAAARFAPIIAGEAFANANAHSFAVTDWRLYDQLIFSWHDTSADDHYTATAYTALLEQLELTADTVRLALNDSDELLLTPHSADDRLTVRFEGTPVPAAGDTLSIWGFTGAGARGRTGPHGPAPRFSAGDAFPTAPAPRQNDFHLFAADVAATLDWLDTDGVSSITDADRGDVARYDGSAWVKQANIVGPPPRTLNPDWNEDDPSSPDFIRNRGRILNTAIPASRAGRHDVAETILTALHNVFGLVGLAADADDLYVANITDDVYALDINDKTLNGNRSVLEETIRLANPNIIVTDVDVAGDTLFAADSVTDEVFAYDIANLTRNPGADIDSAALLLISNTFNCAGVAVDGGLIWVADGANNSVHAFDRTTKGRVAAKDLSPALVQSAAADISIAALTTDGETIWIADDHNTAVWAFDVAGAPARAPAKDIPTAVLQRASASITPRGLATGRNVIWVADFSNSTIWAFEKPETLHEAVDLVVQDGSVEYDERVRALKFGDGLTVANIEDGIATVAQTPAAGLDFFTALISERTGVAPGVVETNTLAIDTATGIIVNDGDAISVADTAGNPALQMLTVNKNGLYALNFSIRVRRTSGGDLRNVTAIRLDVRRGANAVAGTAPLFSQYVRNSGDTNTTWLHGQLYAKLEDGDVITLGLLEIFNTNFNITVGGNGSIIQAVRLA